MRAVDPHTLPTAVHTPGTYPCIRCWARSTPTCWRPCPTSRACNSPSPTFPPPTHTLHTCPRIRCWARSTPTRWRPCPTSRACYSRSPTFPHTHTHTRSTPAHASGVGHAAPRHAGDHVRPGAPARVPVAAGRRGAALPPHARGTRGHIGIPPRRHAACSGRARRGAGGRASAERRGDALPEGPAWARLDAGAYTPRGARVRTPHGGTAAGAGKARVSAEDCLFWAGAGRRAELGVSTGDCLFWARGGARSAHLHRLAYSHAYSFCLPRRPVPSRSEAEPLARRAYEGRDALLGADAAATLSSASLLSGVLQEQGKIADAETLARRNLEQRTRVAGPNDPTTLAAVDSLAQLLVARGALGEAEGLLRRATDGRTVVLGARHADTLSSMHNLAALLRVRRQAGRRAIGCFGCGGEGVSARGCCRQCTPPCSVAQGEGEQLACWWAAQLSVCSAM
eukprot:321783-Chlamydomonas_euryale.AAC.1